MIEMLYFAIGLLAGFGIGVYASRVKKETNE